jgi:glutamate racemase
MIGVFDSGLKGLTVLEALLGRLPSYDYFYLGDSRGTPTVPAARRLSTDEW